MYIYSQLLCRHTHTPCERHENRPCCVMHLINSLKQPLNIIETLTFGSRAISSVYLPAAPPLLQERRTNCLFPFFFSATGEQLEWIWGEVGPQPRRRRILRAEGEPAAMVYFKKKFFKLSDGGNVWPPLFFSPSSADRHRDQGRHRPLPSVCHHPAGLPAPDPLQPLLRQVAPSLCVCVCVCKEYQERSRIYFVSTYCNKW